MIYEYGISHSSTDEPHREGMTEDEAYRWIEEWAADGGKRDAFYVIRRRVEDWEEVQ